MNKLNFWQIARQALVRHKGRTALSVLGVTIGITTLIVVFSAGQGIKQLIINQVNSFGTDYIEVEVKVPTASQTSSENATGIAQGVTITTLTLDDAEDIKKLDNIKDYYAGILSQDVVSYQGQNNNIFIYGVNASFIDIDPGELQSGRFFSNEEDKGLARVAVLGQKVAQNLFAFENPIGKKIKINGINYEVIGVMEPKGANFFFDQDKMIYLPIRTVQKLILGVDYVSFIFFQVYDNDLADITVAEMEDILRENHNITDPQRDDFGVTTAQEALDILGSVTAAISILLLLIGSVSLTVGGVGIMNIMFVSVSERVNEIGLRKAVGAKNSDIRAQFLAEAVLITLLGGILGVTLGVLISYLIFIFANHLGFDWPLIIQLRFLLFSTLISVLVGVVAGYVPASQAAKLDPIEAMRKD